jgi:hypothetical protein
MTQRARVDHMAIDELDLPFAVTQIGTGDGEPVIVLPGGPCRGVE